jgi:trans-aconitate methyltransferase
MAHEWDAEHYLRYADARTLPAIDLLSGIGLTAPRETGGTAGALIRRFVGHRPELPNRPA